jgi:hypothetical protein
MRDGTALVGDVHLPLGPVDGLPTVVIRTPYGKQAAYYTGPAWYLARHGYAVYVQDVRGRCDSEGSFYPFFNNEGPDGFDTIEWVAAQPWSNGRVGMMGGSYSGWVQWCAASQRPPHLIALASASAATRWFQQVPYHNGVPTLAHLAWLFALREHVMQDRALVDNWIDALMHLPLMTADEVVGVEMPVWREWLSHSRFDEFWSSQRLQPADFRAVTQPVLHITATYDGTQPGALYVWEGAQAHGTVPQLQHMIFGPWDHLGAASSMQKRTLGGVDFGPDSVIDVNDIHRQWFDRWLKEIDSADDDFPVARVFFTGVNQWTNADAWPPKGHSQSWYLHSGGNANSAQGDGRLGTSEPGEEPNDVLVSDPLNPIIDVPDLAVYVRPDPLNPVEAPLNRDFVEARSDILVYTSEPQARDLVVAGEPRLVLFGGSDAPDTDWHAWLTDVSPDGESITLVRGQLCSRFRDSLEEEHFMEPGTTYRFEFELLSLAHVFRAGHRIRLVLGPSDFPTYARNQNTGNPIGMDAETRVATNFVSHRAGSASHLLLPITELPAQTVADLPARRDRSISRSVAPE